MSCDNSWPAEAGRTRRETALIADTEEWIEELRGEAHWARTPDIRKASLERARILKDLLELTNL